MHIDHRVRWNLCFVFAAAGSLMSGCAAVDVASTAYSAIATHKDMKAAGKAVNTLGQLQDYDKVYVVVKMYDGAKRAEVKSKLSEMLAKDVNDIRAKGLHVPDVVMLDDASSLGAEKGAALVVVEPRNTGITDTVTELTSDHGMLTVYDLGNGRMKIASREIELQDGLFVDLDAKIDGLHSMIGEMLFDPRRANRERQSS